MDLKPPLTQLEISTAEGGFYDGFARVVAVSAKVIIGALIFWAIAFPDNAGWLLNAVNSVILATFNYWYVWSTTFFVVLCIALAAVPAAGRMRLGEPDDQPEFTNFSWFSMMFGRVSVSAC